MKRLLLIIAMALLVMLPLSTLAEEMPTLPTDPYLKQINKTMKIPGLLRAQTNKRFTIDITQETSLGYDEPVTWKVTTTGGTPPYQYSYIVASEPPSENTWISEGAKSNTTDTEFSYQFCVPNRYMLFVTVTDSDSYSETVYTSSFVLSEDEDHPCIETIVAEIAQECKSARNGDFDRAVWLHDYLTKHACYDRTYSFYGADGVLLRKTGVCDSYRKAYTMLLRAVGIEAGGVSGGNHAWVIAKLDGDWYMIDPTWDDPLTSNDAIISGKENHLYLGLTDEILAFDHAIQEYEAGYAHTCNAIKDNYAYRTGEAKEWITEAPYGKSVGEQLTEQLSEGGMEYELTTVALPIYHDGSYYMVEDNPRVWMPVAWTMSEEDWTVENVKTPVYVTFNPVDCVLNASLDLERMYAIRLPSNTAVIAEEAMLGNAMTGYVILSDQTETIGSKAFADCSALMCVEIPDSVKNIADDAFEGCNRVTVLCSENSAAMDYAIEHGIKYLCCN